MRQKLNAYYENTILPAAMLTCLTCLILLIAAPLNAFPTPQLTSYWDVDFIFLLYLIPMTVEDTIVYVRSKFREKSNSQK